MPHAGKAAVRVVDEAMADLHLDRYIQFATFGIERVVFCGIRCFVESMRV